MKAIVGPQDRTTDVLQVQTAQETRLARSGYLSTEGGKIAYSIQGRGPIVVCIPSMGDLRDEYRFLVPQLVEAGYTAVTMDVRGHGESSTGWADYTVAGVGRDIVALIRLLATGPALLVGASMAAGAAVYAAAEAPQLIKGMVLIGPFVRDIPEPGYMKLLYRILFARPWGPGAWVKYYKTLYPGRLPADFADYAAKLQANLGQEGRIEALRSMLLASKHAAEERLARVAVPVLVLMGAQDPDFKDPQAEAGLVAARLRGEVRTLAGAGHYPHAEMPEQIGQIIIEFLARVGNRAARVI